MGPKEKEVSEGKRSLKRILKKDHLEERVMLSRVRDA